MKQQNKPHFFCEFCHAEVRPDARVCTKCGHFFASVRCPQCGKTGTLQIFSNGCPDCGYAGNTVTQTIEESLPRKKEKGIAYNDPSQRKKSLSDESLPKWLYILTACIFIGLCAVFYFIGTSN